MVEEGNATAVDVGEQVGVKGALRLVGAPVSNAVLTEGLDRPLACPRIAAQLDHVISAQEVGKFCNHLLRAERWFHLPDYILHHLVPTVREVGQGHHCTVPTAAPGTVKK